jgi:hypothetical protein
MLLNFSDPLETDNIQRVITAYFISIELEIISIELFCIELH